MTRVPIVLPNGTRAFIETTDDTHEADVTAGVTFGLDKIFAAVEGLAAAAKEPLARLAPKKATLEVGLTTTFEAGTLVAVFVKGSGEASIKVTFEW